MSGRTGTRCGWALPAVCILAPVPGLLYAAPAADWSALLETWAALPWCGRLWWMLRTALALAAGAF